MFGGWIMTQHDRSHHLLNQLRHDGLQTLQSQWKELYQTDQKKALSLINDEALEFPTLFALRGQFASRGYDGMIERNRIALSHIENVLHGADLGIDKATHFVNQHDLVITALLWVLDTGAKTFLSIDYIQVIDHTAMQMILTYKQDWLKEFVDLIFYRYKSKSQRHYLLSALFDTANPRSLVYISNYLLSDNSVEREYARRLLSFIPEVQHALSDQSAFFAFENWFEKNGHYLVYTGETNDALPYNRPYRIHYTAQYFGKSVSPRDGRPIQSLLASENDHYLAFSKLPLQKQVYLSSYSVKLRQADPDTWRTWISGSLNNQLRSIPLEQRSGS